MKINKEKLNQAILGFKNYLEQKEAQHEIEERKERRKYFKNLFKRKFDEFVFKEIIKNLWASQMWSNKEYLANKIIKDNDPEKLSKYFTDLISGKASPGKRYERFLNSIKGMGPSMVTEILSNAEPKNAGIWNDRARRALAWLEAEEIPYEKYKLSGKDYDIFNNFLKKLAEILSKKIQKNFDLLFVDYFLWKTWDKFSKTGENVVQEVGEKIAKKGSRHDEIKDKISAIGSWLGFEVETEKIIAPGARVDVVWSAKIANLGAVSYVFEVQDKGSIDSLILNLQRAQTVSTVQKLIVVSDPQQLEKIKLEIGTLSESFRKAVSFWNFDDVENTYQNLEQVATSMIKLKLLEE